VGNVFIEQIPHHGPGDWPLPPAAIAAAQGLPEVAHVGTEIPRLHKPAAPVPALTENP
jgi:nitrogenase molybdenum-iron protein NifN